MCKISHREYLGLAILSVLLVACSGTAAVPRSDQASSDALNDVAASEASNIDAAEGGDACLPLTCPTDRPWNPELCTCAAVDASACLPLTCPTDRPWNPELCTCAAVDASACLPLTCPTDRPWNPELCTCAAVDASACLPLTCPTDRPWNPELCTCATARE
jgi:hypothetical protein